MCRSVVFVIFLLLLGVGKVLVTGHLSLTEIKAIQAQGIEEGWDCDYSIKNKRSCPTNNYKAYSKLPTTLTGK